MKLDAKFEGEIRKVKDGSIVPKPMPMYLRSLHAEIAHHLEQIEKLFKGNPKITLVVRNSDSPTHEKDVLMGNDSAERAISAIRELTANPAYILPPYSEVKP